MKKVWYKRWWGVILAIAFLPLFAFWWVWKKSKLAPKIKKVLLIVIGIFDVLIYSILVYASIVSAGAPVLHSVKSPVNQEIISISGSNVASEATVKLILNGNESQQAKADSSGKFTFSEVKLNEGENKVKALTVTTEGKTKESAEMKIVYQKPSETAQTMPTTTIPTSTPSTTTTASDNQASSADKDKVVSILTDSVNHYKQLLSQGKSILGTTPYSDAYAGLAAMNDSNSPAAKFGVFRNTLSEGDNLNEYYNKYGDASDYLYSKKISEYNDILNDWRDNMSQVDVDLNAWASDAVKWQISTLSTSELSKDEQKVLDGLNKANEDIAEIK